MMEQSGLLRAPLFFVFLSSLSSLFVLCCAMLCIVDDSDLIIDYWSKVTHPKLIRNKT